MHRNGKRTSTALSLALAVLISIGVCSCGKETPLRPHVRGANDQTLKEQQEWAELQIEQVIAITGTAGRWRGDSDQEPGWEEHRQQILDEARRSSCTFEAGKVNPAQLLLDVWADRVESDPFTSAERVREQWKSDGWGVSDVIRREDTVSGNEIEFRADRADGSMLALSAIREVRGGILSLTVQAACSAHPSVAW